MDTTGYRERMAEGQRLEKVEGYAYACGWTEQILKETLDDLDQCVWRRELAGLLIGFLFDHCPEAEDDTSLEDAREWLAERGYGGPQAPKNVLVPVGHD